MDLYASASANDWIFRILLNALALFAGSWFVRGVEVRNFGGAILAAILLALLNATLGRLLDILSFPLTILTLGLFSFVVDALILLLASNLIKGFHVRSFWPAFWLAVILALFNVVLHGIYL